MIGSMYKETTLEDNEENRKYLQIGRDIRDTLLSIINAMITYSFVIKLILSTFQYKKELKSLLASL